ncbi:M36 family metallopeptidase [Hymenobacter gummosus]|uniref:M36 family metallopeptidase n=1 Tax=Hymenobacter gummosus TaxID=1776032 RepID=UPI001404DFAB|nr:M36 family metallopeptidase [Hymenobacter gummosus]
MRKTSTRQRLGLLALGLLLPFAPLHAQSAPDQGAYQQALQTRSQWAGPGFSADDMRLSSAYAEANGLQHVYVQQVHRGIPVYNQILSLAFKGGRLASHAGVFVPSKQLADLAVAPGVPAATAVRKALQHLDASHAADASLVSNEGGAEARQTFAAPGVARRDIEARLVWATDTGRPRLAWNVNVDLRHVENWANVRIDAASGAIIGQDSWTADVATDACAETHLAAPAAAPARNPYAAAYLPPPPPSAGTAAYLVLPYPSLSPNHASLRLETDPWLKAGAGNNATTHGWHYDGTTDYLTTRGNNVSAYDDAANQNAPGNFATSQTASPALSFNFTPDFNSAPSTVANRNAAVVNLFYWNNIIHDVLYQFGFTEAAGNFQADNLGRGGRGNDYVRAEAQDGAGTNNANFSTPPDGSSGRMQMFLWNSAAPAPLVVTSPAAIAGSYTMVEGNLSANNKLSVLGPVSGEIVRYVDAGSSPATNLACTTPANVLTGKIALITRGGACGFAAQVKNAQTAGAIGVVVANNLTGNPITMTGSDNTITIPAVMVSRTDALRITNQLDFGTPVQVTLSRVRPQLDGDFDNGIVVHEYGHGVSNRLTGGTASASCLGNVEQGGEGWSDYLSLMLNTDWSTAQLTDGPLARPMGTYAAGQANTGRGIRRYPYSTSLSVQPLTYANVAANPQVHAIGEIWCATLWDMTWAIIEQQNRIEPNLYNGASTGGNTVALQLVMQGMKLQPCQPGFLDARDAILRADSLLYNGQYHCTIWRAFARRGMGYSAVQGSSNSGTDQVAASDMPPPVTLQKTATLLSGSTFDVTLRANCNCAVPGTPYTLTTELPAGLQHVPGSGGTLVGNKVTFSNLTFTANGQVQTLRFRAAAAPGSLCPILMPVDDNQDGSTLGSFSSQALTGTINTWNPSSVLAYSPTRAWRAIPPTVPADFVLTSAPFTPTGLSTLSFYHYFNTEGGFDGGTVELSTDNGATWLDAGPYFVANGYNSTFDATTTAPNQGCFSGRGVTGPTNTFIRTLVNLSSFAGTPLRLRFRMRTDQGSPATFEGWFIDDIQVMNGCGGRQLVELRDGAGALAGSGSIITYLVGPLAQHGAQAAQLQLSAQPNPFGAAGLQLTLTAPTAPGTLTLSLYDVAGRVLLRRPAERLSSGSSSLRWPETAQLPAGLYLVRAQLADGSSTVLRVVKE